MDIFLLPKILRDAVGNNRFGQSGPNQDAFVLDTETLGGPTLCLEVPKRIFGTFDDVRLSRRVAFRESVDGGARVEMNGLENFVSTEWHGIPIHVFDNHNYALAFWLEAYAEGRIQKGSTLVHIDMHSDLWKNEFSLDLTRAGDASYVEDFVNLRTEVGNYVDPAIRSGLIGRVVKIEGEGELEAAVRVLDEWSSSFVGDDSDSQSISLKQDFESESRRRNEPESLILNLDLDFFAPDLDYIPFELKKRAVLGYAKKARLITVATSPGFVDGKLALEVSRRLFD